MNILLTGCMGFIGSNLVSSLLNKGHQIIGFDNLTKPSIEPTDRIKQKLLNKNDMKNFTFYHADVCNISNMKSILAVHEKVDAIIHLAAIGSIPLSFKQPSTTLETNVVGFSNVCELARSFRIPKVVFASSSSVYGGNNINPRKEGSETFQISPYSLSKRINEQLAPLILPIETDFIGLRFFNVYGPGQQINSEYNAVIPNFIINPKPTVYGNGEVIRDFTFVDDVSDAISRSLLVKVSTVLNVGTGVQTSLNDLLTILGKKESAIYERQRINDVKMSYADTTKAKEVLGFSAKISLSDGIKRTKEFYDDYMINC